jgi:hypothetical protein
MVVDLSFVSIDLFRVASKNSFCISDFIGSATMLKLHKAMLY